MRDTSVTIAIINRCSIISTGLTLVPDVLPEVDGIFGSLSISTEVDNIVAILLTPKCTSMALLTL